MSGSLPGNKAKRWKGGRNVDKRGYVRLWHPTAVYVYEHRIVAERLLGRPLLKTEIVHHRNGHKGDNRPENLVVLAIEDHPREHGPAHRIAQWSRKYLACRECGTTTRAYKGRGWCTSCYSRWWAHLHTR